MQKLMPLFTLLFSAILASGQYKYFDISKYKLPDIKRHQLDFGFQSYGNKNSEFAIFKSGTWSDTTDNNQYKYSGGVDFTYSFYRNSDKIQSNLKANISGDFQKSQNFRYNNYIEDQSYQSNYMSVSYDLKYFMVPGNWFIGIVPDGYYSFSNTKNFKEDYDWKISQRAGGVKIGIGKGRIEQVQDFRHAVLIVDELEKRGVLLKAITEEEMIMLSSLISELKNKRFFDERKRKEAELTAIDSFLVAGGIIRKENGMGYFSGLEDMWSFGGLPVRESGSQFLFSIRPNYYFYKSWNEVVDTIIGSATRERFNMVYNLEYVSKKPLSVQWQRDFKIGINHSHLKSMQEFYDGFPDNSYVSGILFNGDAGYFPNTRTSFSLGGLINLMNRSENKILDDQGYAFRYQIYTSGYYYISERLRLGYSIHFDSETGGIFNRELENIKVKNFQYYIYLNYAIF